VSFIENCGAYVQLKIRDLDNRENPIDYDGDVTKEQLIVALDKYKNLIFHDGYHDLILRNPITEDYIAFDEHGLISIYSKDDYTDTLNQLNVSYKADENLIYDFDHWHYGPANRSEDLKNLITELRLEA
jgi:hypothetical protein